MTAKKKTPKQPSFDDVVEKFYRDGEQYQRDVADIAEKLGPTSPEFTQWCHDTDDWNVAVQQKET